MTYDEFSKSVETLVKTLQFLATEKNAPNSFCKGFPAVDYTVAACLAAHQITGYDRGFCLLFNKNHREAAVKYAYNSA